MTDSLAVTVRRSVRRDLPAIYRIETLSFDQPWPINAFEAYLDEPAFLVAVSEQDIVGFILADLTPNDGRTVGHVKDLAVEPPSRGEGLGRLLLRSALNRLIAAGAAVVKLEVRAGNDSARSLYRSEGFQSLRRVPDYYDDGETAFVLVLNLAEWEPTAPDNSAESADNNTD